MTRKIPFVIASPRRRAVFFLFALALFFTGCLPKARRAPDLDAIFAQTRLRQGKRPVIIIPGILGSELVNADTRERVWIYLTTPKTDGLSLPISPDLRKNRDRIVATRILERARVSSFLPEVSIYEALIRAMERYGGYTKGDWDNPETAGGGLDKYYVFAYDWRRDNVENAQLLVRKVRELKQKLGNPELRFDVIAHSMGGLITRYAAMYGDADLPADDVPPVPNWSGARHFDKIFMFGTPNEGSMQTMKLLLRGYSIGGFDISVLNREVALTSPAVFQLLPHQRTARFYDEDLSPLTVDLYDPETWRKYGWSAWADPSFRNKFAGQPGAVSAGGRKSEFADVSLADLDAYFVTVLNRARLFHAALDADTAVPPSISFFAFGSDCDPTQDGAILRKSAKTGGWQTMFSAKDYRTAAGRTISESEAAAKLYAPGDTIVTRRSLLAETLVDQNYRNSIFRRNLPVTSIFSCETHNELPNSKILQDNFLTALLQELQ